MDLYLNTNEVAQICHVSRGSVIRRIHDGKLPAAVTPGGHHRIHAAELVLFLKSMNMSIPEGFKPYEPIQEPAPARNYRLLIVDDEGPIRKMLRLFVEKYFPEFEIDEAHDGFSAGWKAHGSKPDLVLLDIMLPGLDGYGVCKFIRTFKELKDCKIIVITGLPEEVAKDKMMELGANDFLTKPIDPNRLKQKICEHLGLAGESRAA